METITESDTARPHEEEDLASSGEKEPSYNFPAEFNYSLNNEHYSSPLVRKRLPQTSILASMHLKNELTVDSGLDSIISPISDFETELISLAGFGQIAVTRRIRELLAEILAKYPECSIGHDQFSGSMNVYKHMYDLNYNHIRKIKDFSGPPNGLILSCRYCATQKNSIFIPEAKTIRQQIQTKMQMIDMYGSVINKKKEDTQKKSHKPGLQKLQKVHSELKIALKKPKEHKITKSQPVLVRSSKAFESFRPIIPPVNGKKVIEGTAGFKKGHPQDNLKGLNSPRGAVPNTYRDSGKLPKLSISPEILEEIMKIDEACLKNSITRQEYKGIVSLYYELKGMNNSVTAYSVAKTFVVNPSIFKGISLKVAYRKSLRWAEFLKFYTIIHLKRSGFAENLEFLFRYLGITTIKQLQSREPPQLSILNSLFKEKLNKILQVFASNPELISVLGEETCEVLQEQGVSNSDLRVLISLLSAPNN